MSLSNSSIVTGYDDLLLPLPGDAPLLAASSRDLMSHDRAAILTDLSVTTSIAVNSDSPLDYDFNEIGDYVFSTPAYHDISAVDVYQSCISGFCSCCHFIGTLPSQLKPCRATQFLFGGSAIPSIADSDRLFLWRGFVNGFSIVDDDCPSEYYCPNYDSITGPGAYDEMSALLKDELSCGKVSVTDSRPTCVHSLGAVRKSNGKLRPITDCSRPDGSSINNFMQSTFHSFSYNSVDSAVQCLNQSDYMAVVDIASAYRSVNILDDHVKFQGLSWDFGSGPVWLRDHRMCFGLRCAPNIFNAISDFVVQIAVHKGASRVINYLDDFLIIASDAPTCLAHRNVVTCVLEHLGFIVSWKKVTDPSPVTTFLGITIDSTLMELSLPLEKVEKLKNFITMLLDKGSASKKELERIGGLVSHCSYVVRGGRTFSRRIFDLAASYSRHSRAIPLNDAILADLQWWLSFCGNFNGKACIIRDLHPIPLYSDSSFEGFGAWMGRDWIYGYWAGEPVTLETSSSCLHLLPPPVFDQPPKNINVYELWPVVVGIKRWAKFFVDARIHIITDNMQVLAMINTGRSCNKTCMTWLREIFWTCFIYNMEVQASYIRSADNHLADALSRLAYKGTESLCVSLLTSTNMCCSSLPRTILGLNQIASGDAEGCSIRPVDPEVAPVSTELLPGFL